ncbi:MAG: phage portal protein [Candidatus Paceibacterota bacterium]|jgi:hypothetical protein
MQVDYNHLIKLAYPGQPSIFTDSQLDTINQLIEYADWYDGENFKYIEQRYPEYRSAKDYTPTKLTINLARYIINKLASWQFEQPVDYNCTPDGGRYDQIEEDIYQVHKDNLLDSKYLQAATECNITGGVVFKLKYDIEDKRVRIMPRNRIECFPVYDFDDYEKINKVHFVAFIDEYTIWKQTYELVKDASGKNVCYIEEATYDVKNNLQIKQQILERQPLGYNGRWLDFMPVYIIPNLPQIGEVWGISELKDLIPLFEEIDKKYSDLSDSLKFDMFAITVLLNTKVPVGADGKPKLKGHAGAVWNLAQMAATENIRPDVFKLQSTFNYIDTLKYHIDSLVALVYELSEVVNLSVDRVAGIGNLSGVALKLLFAAILSKTRKKNTIWAARLRDMWFGVLKMKSIYEGYDIPDDLDIDIITHIPMPQNEVEQVEVITSKISAGLVSVRTAMNELQIENPEAEIAKIIEEQIEYDKRLNLDQVKNNGNQ